jgi:hypothetical protein
MRTILFSIAACCLMITNVWAEHEVDHRYNIRGYVLNQSQQGIVNQEVKVFDGNKMLAKGTTDSDGYYSLHLHLHNADNGRTLKLRAGTNETELRVTFDTTDLTTLRVHDANIVGGEFVEGNLGVIRVPPWSYAVGGLLLFILLAFFLEKRRKKKLRIAKHGPKEKHSPSGHKAKKSRRKKH